MILEDIEWQKRLTPEQFQVLRLKGTEIPGSGALLNNNEAGVYRCAACHAVVFESDAKYDTHTPGLIGWPSFSSAANKGAIEIKQDNSAGMQRLEAVCSNCGGHLGHLFDDRSSPNGKHYCINSVSLEFEPDHSLNKGK
ncbi:MAG: peptide-methionine (R)-S-oxide reductase MsrB [Candidatus Saccharimonadales bacterium]